MSKGINKLKTKILITNLGKLKIQKKSLYSKIKIHFPSEPMNDKKK